MNRVLTGFSKPKVAQYVNTNGTISYTGGMELALGVSVALNPTASDNAIFYGNNGPAISGPARLTGGDVQYTVSEPEKAAISFIYGLPEADQEGWTHYGDSVTPPYLGTGYIERYTNQDGTESWRPIVLTKVKATTRQSAAATQEAEIAFQTGTITFNLFRDDSANHDWKAEGNYYATEALAEAALNAYLGISASQGHNGN